MHNMDKENVAESGYSMISILNEYLTILNYHVVVLRFSYDSETDCINAHSIDTEISFPRKNFSVADWDANDTDTKMHDASFYMILDNDDIVHIFNFFKADSREIMKQLRRHM